MSCFGARLEGAFFGPITRVILELMAFPIKICVVCEEEFELKPGKPGFANRCPECSTPEAMEGGDKSHKSAEELQSEKEMNEARRKTIRDMLYRKES
jgi:hypothetical protein